MAKILINLSQGTAQQFRENLGECVKAN